MGAKKKMTEEVEIWAEKYREGVLECMKNKISDSAWEKLTSVISIGVVVRIIAESSLAGIVIALATLLVSAVTTLTQALSCTNEVIDVIGPPPKR